MSGQLDQDGVRVTLIHSGRHKVDGNPYEPLPDAVQNEIQREIDVLRFLFTETVAAGRFRRLSQEAALATEAATFRGADAVAAGLADEVTDLARGFAAFRQMVARSPILSPTRSQRVAATQFRKPTHPREEAIMATENDPEDSPQDMGPEVTDIEEDETDATDVPLDAPARASAASQPPAAAAPALAQTAPQAGNLAELSAQLREAAAEIAEIAAQAGRLGIAIDAAKALREGTTPEALRRLVLERASAAADARDIVAAPRSPVLPLAKESPIVAAAKRQAAAGNRA
ncbi:MAG: S49 family peptidase, partial [Thermaurantiacus sp.]